MRVYSNDAVPTALTSGVDSSASTIPVGDTTGWPDPGSSDEAVAAISHGEAGAVEVVTYTGKTATEINGVTRGQDGTAAVAHDSGANVAHVASAADVEAVYDHASRHEPGGDDALTVDAATGTGSLRTLGSGSQQASAGDHSHDLDDLSDVDDSGGSEGDALVKQGDGSWAPDSVGGSAANLPALDASTNYVLPGWYWANTVTDGGFSAGWLVYVPIFVDRERTYSHIGVYVQTSGTSGDEARLGIYQWDEGPTDLVVDAGTVDLSSGGSKEVSFNQTLPAGAYAVAVVWDGAGSPEFLAPDDAFALVTPFGGITLSVQQGVNRVVVAAADQESVVSGGLPGSAPAVTAAQAAGWVTAFLREAV